jgi:hypothetical protein
VAELQAMAAVTPERQGARNAHAPRRSICCQGRGGRSDQRTPDRIQLLGRRVADARPLHGNLDGAQEASAECDLALVRAFAALLNLTGPGAAPDNIAAI